MISAAFVMTGPMALQSLSTKGVKFSFSLYAGMIMEIFGESLSEDDWWRRVVTMSILGRVAQTMSICDDLETIYVKESMLSFTI